VGDELTIQLKSKEIEQLELYMAKKPRYYLERTRDDLLLPGIQEV